GRQADRNVGRQRDVGERYRLQLQLRRRDTKVSGKLVLCHRELLLQRRQRRFGRRQLRAHGERVGQRLRTDRLLLLRDVEFLLQRIDDLVRGLDLLAQRRFLQRSGDDIGRQGQIGRVKLRAADV